MALPSCCVLFCLLLPYSIVPGSARENKACSNLFHLEALRWVRTVCVDTSYLREGETSDVKTFVARENQPGHLLRRLNWEFTDQCAAANAVIRVYFAQTEVNIHRTDVGPRPDVGQGGVASSSVSEEEIQVVLLIYDRASVRILYRTETQYKGPNRRTMLKDPFSRLVKDLRRLGQ